MNCNLKSIKQRELNTAKQVFKEKFIGTIDDKDGALWMPKDNKSEHQAYNHATQQAESVIDWAKNRFGERFATGISGWVSLNKQPGGILIYFDFPRSLELAYMVKDGTLELKYVQREIKREEERLLNQRIQELKDGNNFDKDGKLTFFQKEVLQQEAEDILEKVYGKDNVKTITDEYGNQWREINLGIDYKNNIQFQKQDIDNLNLTQDTMNYLYKNSNHITSREQWIKDAYNFINRMRAYNTNQEIIEKLKCF